jgi:hypothetical protein
MSSGYAYTFAIIGDEHYKTVMLGLIPGDLE